MRIIAGEFGGRVIDSPSERTTRPTTDRVRESIFSSVYSRLPDLTDVIVLDAFAGSGALGIEALSRGAASCTFVERDRAARAVLEKNLSTLGLKAPRVRVIAGDVFEAAERHALVPLARFSLVLLDPPYAEQAALVRDLLVALDDRGQLADGCLIVYEHALDDRQAVAEEFASGGRFALDGQKKYGKIGVTYLKYDEREDCHA